MRMADKKFKLVNNEIIGKTFCRFSKRFKVNIYYRVVSAELVESEVGHRYIKTIVVDHYGDTQNLLYSAMRRYFNIETYNSAFYLKLKFKIKNGDDDMHTVSIVDNEKFDEAAVEHKMSLYES